MLPRRVTHTLTSKDSLRNGQRDYEFAGNEVRYAVSLSTQQAVSGSSSRIVQNYSPQAEAALTNFNTLLLLEIALLFQDFYWSPPTAFEGRLQDSAVLSAAAPADDDDNSGQKQSAAAAPGPATAAGLLQVEAGLDTTKPVWINF